MELRDRIIAIETLKLGQVAAHEKNPKTHPAAQQETMRGVLREVGWAGVPLVYHSARNGGRLTFLDGHLRQELVPEAEVRVAVTDLTDAEADEFLLLYDPLTALAEVNKDAVAALFASVKAQDGVVAEFLKQQMALAGVDDPEKHAAMPTSVGEDYVAATQAEFQVQAGDVWAVGDDLFVGCGDCQSRPLWDALLAAAQAEKVNVIITSPPYAMQRKNKYGGIPVAEYVAWWGGVQAVMRDLLADDGSFFVNIKPHVDNGQRSLYVMDLVLAMVREWGWCYIDEFQWLHQGYPGDLRGRFKNQFETVFQFAGVDGALAIPLEAAEAVQHFALQVAAGLNFHPEQVLGKLSAGHEERLKERQAGNAVFTPDYELASGMGNFQYYKKLRGARPGNVIHASIGEVGHKHAAQFPLKLPQFFIRAFSNVGDVVADPFMGGGTTLLAAASTRRRGIGTELLPEYVAVILDTLRRRLDHDPVKIAVANS